MTLVLIDTPPHVEAPCREAAKLADLVVIPCGPTAPDLEAIKSLDDHATASWYSRAKNS